MISLQQEPIYSNSSLFSSAQSPQNNGNLNTMKHVQNGSVQSLIPSLPSASPYVTYSLDPALHNREHSLMDVRAMENFADRRRSVLNGSTQSIYNQLQYPAASNFGSMKRKKKKQESEHSEKVKLQAPSSTESESSGSSGAGAVHGKFQEEEYMENNVKVWSLQYVPQVFSFTKKTVKV